MPFPLAHPAAVLPLRRIYPKWLNLTGLVIGSISPDLAYLFGKLRLEQVSHELWGILGFCLPAGLGVTLLLYLVRPKLIGWWPGTGRFLPPAEVRGPISLIGIVLSVLIGAGTHLAWDSFTHASGWVAERLPVLQTTLGIVAGHRIRVCRLLWYASSFAGIAYAYLVFRSAQWRPAGGSPGAEDRRPRLKWVEACAVGALLLPIELVHDLMPNPRGTLVVAGLSLLLVVTVVWVNKAWRTGARESIIPDRG